MAAATQCFPIPTWEIDIPEGRRPADTKAVRQLANSIEEIGLVQPIVVRRKGDRYELVAGLHRVRAFEALKKDYIPSMVVSLNKAEARMSEIAENLHRAELTAQERADQIDEWRELAKVRKDSSPLGRQPKESGIREASRELGIDPKAIRNAAKIASITPEAKEAAREAGIDDNQSKLLKVAAAPPSQQVAAVRKLAAPISDDDSVDKQVAAVMAAWNRAGPEAREKVRALIDQPVMGKRWA